MNKFKALFYTEDLPNSRFVLPLEAGSTRRHLSFEGFLIEGGLSIPSKCSIEPDWFFELRNKRFYRKWRKVQEAYNDYLEFAKHCDKVEDWEVACQYSLEHYGIYLVAHGVMIPDEFKTPDEAIAVITAMKNNYPSSEKALKEASTKEMDDFFKILERTPLT